MKYYYELWRRTKDYNDPFECVCGKTHNTDDGITLMDNENKISFDYYSCSKVFRSLDRYLKQGKWNGYRLANGKIKWTDKL